jgi:hypothetical protein
MPLFRHHHDAPGPGRPGGVPGLASFAATPGWQPAGDRPFDGHLEDAVAEINRAMHGAARTLGAVRLHGIRVGATVFQDACRGSIDGRAVIVANAWTNIGPELRGSTGKMYGAAVCAVELPSILPIRCVQPRRFPPVVPVRDSPAGSPAFDEQFRVTATPVPGLDQPVLTPDVQQRMMAHDDWVFWAERYLLGCVSKGPFRTAGEVSQRIGEVLGIVAAFPASVLPGHVDHSGDDLIARVNRLTSMDQGLALLQQLTPGERERLARSDSPLAALADVRTPQEAMARFKTLDPQRKMQLMVMFMKVRDSQRGH